MKSSNSHGGHSALVRMRLVLNGAVFCISQMGPNYLFVESSVDYPRGRAIIEIQVDDSQ